MAFLLRFFLLLVITAVKAWKGGDMMEEIKKLLSEIVDVRDIRCYFGSYSVDVGDNLGVLFRPAVGVATEHLTFD